MIVDPADPPRVLPALKSLESSSKLIGIINTHHHSDHAGGNSEILEAYPKLPVIGGKDCGATKVPAHGEFFRIGDSISVKALHTPCHTQDSICYLVEDGQEKAVFTGDTLFIGGCGRFFEGTADEMHKALNETLAGLPSDTKVYPGHEYTKSNLKFGQSILTNSAIKRAVEYAENNEETQGRFTIGDEKQHNVFMRPEDPEVQKATDSTDPIEIMGKLREMKNSF